MKRIIFPIFLALITVLSVNGQDPEFEYYRNKEMKTLLGRNRSGGGYVSFTSGYTRIDNEHALLFGGRIAWVASHSVGVGLGATGFMNEYHYNASLDRDVFLAGGYGGLYIEPILFPRSPVHLSFPVLLGGGGISYVSRDRDFNENFIEESKAFLLVEPSAELELNLTRFFRLAFGVSYRFPSKFDIGTNSGYPIDVESLKEMSYTVTMKFGKF